MLLLMWPAVSHLFGIYKSVAIVGPLLVHLLVLQAYYSMLNNGSTCCALFFVEGVLA